jgi:hypothetical protein
MSICAPQVEYERALIIRIRDYVGVNIVVKAWVEEQTGGELSPPRFGWITMIAANTFGYFFWRDYSWAKFKHVAIIKEIDDCTLENISFHLLNSVFSDAKEDVELFSEGGLAIREYDGILIF